jgi:ArsR family transcriptional regulator, arsenate/arsenite/antimonite-responsive transcriptional repressor
MSIHSGDRKAVRVAKALADLTRFRLFRTIAAHGEICCRDLTVLLRVSQATVSHHLKILTEAGLVAARRDGQFSYYRVRPGAMREHARLLGAALATPGRGLRKVTG